MFIEPVTETLAGACVNLPGLRVHTYVVLRAVAEDVSSRLTSSPLFGLLTKPAC